MATLVRKASLRKLNEEKLTCEKNKRQRRATELLYRFAQANGIKLKPGVAAEPCRVKMDFNPKISGFKNMYVILSDDNTKILCWDMIDGSIKTYPNDNSVELITWSIGEMIDRNIAQVQKMDFPVAPFKSYVLEPQWEGQYFTVQEEHTLLFCQKADELGLKYQSNARAKLATCEDRSVWSLRCEKDGFSEEGKKKVQVCYLVADLELQDFRVVDSGCYLWVLEQRVGGNKIVEKLQALDPSITVDSLPYLVRLDGAYCWFYGFSSSKIEGWAYCNIRGGEVVVTDIGLGKLEHIFDKEQSCRESFQLTIGGLSFKAKCWIGFDVVNYRESDD